MKLFGNAFISNYCCSDLPVFYVKYCIMYRKGRKRKMTVIIIVYHLLAFRQSVACRIVSIISSAAHSACTYYKCRSCCKSAMSFWLHYVNVSYHIFVLIFIYLLAFRKLFLYFFAEFTAELKLIQSVFIIVSPHDSSSFSSSALNFSRPLLNSEPTVFSFFSIISAISFIVYPS